jgi:hypothetical protein
MRPKKRRESAIINRGVKAGRVHRNEGGPQLAKNSNKPWTPEEDGRLLQMSLAGESVTAIALVLKRTAIAVERRIYTVRNRDHLAKKASSEFA